MYSFNVWIKNDEHSKQQLMDQNGSGASGSSIWQKSSRLMELYIYMWYLIGSNKELPHECKQDKLNKLQLACISVSTATCKKG
jgi:hypothetical protein